MPAEIHCPKCPSVNVIFSKKRRVYVCEDCGHEFAQEKSAASMRIFLSYGHDANEELVRRIKTDLEQRGHDVWFDKTEIKAGDDWRRSITDGILNSQRVVSFLSKHSTRDPGVCRDEIAIAIGVKGGNIQTILVESEAEVQPPVNISHIQWLDMHDWKERRAAGTAAWEEWYQAKLAEIVRVVESDESRRFAGEIETLDGLPQAHQIRRAHLRPALERLLRSRLDLRRGGAMAYVRSSASGGGFGVPAVAGPDRVNAELQTSRLFWITGDPGVGKSAFAAQLTHTRSDAVIAAQFVEWDKPDHRDARRVVRSLAFQLATRLPDYRKLLLTLPEIAELDRKDPAELFDYLLANPLRSVIGGGRERQLIVIDALDEAGEAGRNPLVEMLARHAPRLPDWLGLVVTSRPESAVQTPLQGLNPFVLDTRTEANRADLRDYLRRQLAPQLHDRPDADRLIGQILEKSEGVFLYVERFCDDVQQNHLSLDRPEQFPQGLGGIFCQWFQRQFPDLEKFRKDVRPALRAILAAREPLPLEILQRLFNWQDEELRDFTRTLGSLFPVTKEASSEVIRPYHKSLAEWLADERKAGEFFVSAIGGHRVLADSGMKSIQENVSTVAIYFLKHLPVHLARASQWTELERLLFNVQFLEAKVANGFLDNLIADFVQATEAIEEAPNAAGRASLQSSLRLLGQVLADVSEKVEIDPGSIGVNFTWKAESTKNEGGWKLRPALKRRWLTNHGSNTSPLTADPPLHMQPKQLFVKNRFTHFDFQKMESLWFFANLNGTFSRWQWRKPELASALPPPSASRPLRYGGVVSDGRFLLADETDLWLLRTENLWVSDLTKAGWQRLYTKPESSCLRNVSTFPDHGYGLIALTRESQASLLVYDRREDRIVDEWQIPLPAPGDFVNHVAVASNNKAKAVCFGGGEILFSTGAQVMAHSGGAYHCDFVDEGTHVVSCGDDGSCALWDLQGGLLKRVELIHGAAECLTYCPRRHLLFVGHRSGYVSYLTLARDHESGSHMGSFFPGVFGWVLSLATSECGSWLAVSGRNGVVRVFDIDAVLQFDFDKQLFSAIAFQPAHQVGIWKAPPGCFFMDGQNHLHSTLTTRDSRHLPLRCHAAFVDSSKGILLAALPEEICVLLPETGEPLKCHRVRGGTRISMAINSDRSRLAVLERKRIVVYDVLDDFSTLRELAVILLDALLTEDDFHLAGLRDDLPIAFCDDNRLVVHSTDCLRSSLRREHDHHTRFASSLGYRGDSKSSDYSGISV